MTVSTAALPPLRQELRIEPGAPLPSGAPGWVLFDPLRHLFFELGALEQRVASVWSRGDARAARDALIADGIHADDAAGAIDAFHRFAVANSLVRDAPVATLAARHVAARKDWWKWLLDHYLFIRIPLVRPAHFLARTLPLARAIWSTAGIAVLAAMALLGMVLVARQWDVFTASFAGLATPQGLATWGAALLFVKVFHELGHAYVATCYGVRVPTMGISLLVLVPVLYTDTSGAWRLRSRSHRIRIAAAGVLAEFSVAAVALLAWSFLPDGALRTGAFLLATTSLATSLLINASPFMRFDGYYILSDLMGVPNLAPRAFALARWRLRELLFALHEPPPEPLPARLQSAMVAYAVVTIAYRTALYIGIALLVYHAVFKALGIILFLVEIYVFLARPIVNEVKEWRTRRAAIRVSPRARWTAGVLAALIALAFLPLDRTVPMPAVLAPLADKPAVTGDPARIEQLLVRSGDTVTAGQPLAVLASPDLELGIAQSRLRIAQTEGRLARGVADAQDLSDAGVMRRDLIAERARLAGLERRRAALTIRAAVTGRVVDLDPDLRPGNWIDGRRPLLRVVSPGAYDVRGYLPEESGWRVFAGSTGRFIPDDAGAPSWRVRLDEVGTAGVGTIDPLLGSVGGGPIATVDRDGVQPKAALVALHLIAEAGDSGGYVQPMRGTVVIAAKGDSLAAYIARRIGQVWSREGSIG